MNAVTRSQYQLGTGMGVEAPPPCSHRPRKRQQTPMASDAHSALADDETIDSAAKIEKTTNMVADTRATTSSPPGQREPFPMGTEEMMRHLANSIANLTEQVQNMHERLDRQDRGDEQVHPTHPSPVTLEGQTGPCEESPAPAPLPREDQREPPAPTRQHPPRQGQLHIGSPSRKGKVVMIDSEPEMEFPHAIRKKRHAHQQ